MRCFGLLFFPLEALITTMAIRLILVCKEGQARNAYLREAMSTGIEVDMVDSFGDLLKMMNTCAYQGIMVDLITSVKASREDKDIAQNVLDAFPVIQLKWDQQTNNIHTISNGAASGGTLAHFIDHECRPFKPRAVRINARKCTNFNVLICKNIEMDPSQTEHSVTVNISKGGCFLFSCQNWSNISEIWMVVHELDDKTPIQGEIRWRQPWGKTMAIPGIGIQIKHITSKQKTQLEEQYSI